MLHGRTTENTALRGSVIHTPLINPSRRIFTKGDELAAGIITGLEKIRCNYGNGDCLYMDLLRSVFAVSDSTERFPSASRDLLVRFASLLRDEGVPVDTNTWASIVKKTYDGQSYHRKATFTCVALRVCEKGVLATVIHGGDSTAMIVDTPTGLVRYATLPDMNFAGRSRDLSVIHQMPITETSDRIVLCTDGIWDLVSPRMDEAGESMLSMLVRHPVNEIPCVFEKEAAGYARDVTPKNFDDAGIIVINPRILEYGYPLAVLMGGTTPQEETRYRMGLGCGITPLSDAEWISTDDINDFSRLSECGIKIM